MDLDTVLTMVGLIAATNTPFYLMSLHNYRVLAWIRTNCPECIQRGLNGADQ